MHQLIPIKLQQKTANRQAIWVFQGSWGGRGETCSKEFGAEETTERYVARIVGGKGCGRTRS